jgi:hypothetical protein
MQSIEKDYAHIINSDEGGEDVKRKRWS